MEEMSSDVTSSDKLWVLLGYIFTPLVPIIVLFLEDKKNRPFIRAHNAQALAWGVVVWVIGLVLTPVFGIGLCVGPILLIISIYWGIQGYQGKYVTIPVLTNFVKNQGWA